MVEQRVFFLFSSGGAPDWPPCGACTTKWGKGGECFLPESLTSANAFVLNRE